MGPTWHLISDSTRWIPSEMMLRNARWGIDRSIDPSIHAHCSKDEGILVYWCLFYVSDRWRCQRIVKRLRSFHSSWLVKLLVTKRKRSSNTGQFIINHIGRLVHWILNESWMEPATRLQILEMSLLTNHWTASGISCHR